MSYDNPIREIDGFLGCAGKRGYGGMKHLWLNGEGTHRAFTF